MQEQVKQETVLETFIKPPETLNEEGLKQASQEAFDPEASKDFVEIGGKSIQMRLLTWKFERRIVSIVSFYLKTILEAAQVQMLEDTLGALLVEAPDDLTRIAVIVLSSQPEVIFDALPNLDTPDGKKRLESMLENWLDDNAHFDEIVNLVQTQLKKNNLAASLGKLWTPGSLGVRALKILNTLESQSGQILQRKLMEYANDTAATTQK